MTVARFFEVIDRDTNETYAVAALTDQVMPGYSRLYRWIPNMAEWVRDDGLLRDYLSFAGDQLNRFAEVSAADTSRIAADLPRISADWILARYAAVDDRLSSSHLQLPPRSESSPPNNVTTEQSAATGP